MASLHRRAGITWAIISVRHHLDLRYAIDAGGRDLPFAIWLAFLNPLEIMVRIKIIRECDLQNHFGCDTALTGAEGLIGEANALELLICPVRISRVSEPLAEDRFSRLSGS